MIAIDGTAGSGKSTLALGLARRLRLAYLNTGVMYRAVTRAALDRGIGPDDGPALAELASSLRFGLSDLAENGPATIEVEGFPPGSELLAPAVEEAVSMVASHPAVRRVLRAEQRRLGAAGGVIEGRDIGSVVFPDADVKLFLRARPDTRAERRIAQREGDESGALADALHERDRRDAAVVPHEPTPDATVIDTSDLDVDESLRRALLAIARIRVGPESEP